jgi:hypothetical protein
MMHPAFREEMLRGHRRELEERVRRASARRVHRPVAAPPTEPVLLRLARVQDDDALDRLAQLEGRPRLTGRHVVAEIGGVVVAALPLAQGPALADPFRPTAHLIPLLELRAGQLARDHARPRSPAVWRTVRVAAGRGPRGWCRPKPSQARAA